MDLEKDLADLEIWRQEALVMAKALGANESLVNERVDLERDALIAHYAKEEE